jgi:hypothetical protein
MEPPGRGVRRGLGGAFFAVFVVIAGAAPMRIGATISLTGPWAVNGWGMRNATVLAVAQANAAGGVDLGPAGGGRVPVELTVVDDGSTAAGARAGMAALLAAGVDLYVGPVSALDGAVLDSLATAGRPTVVVLPVSCACTQWWWWGGGEGGRVWHFRVRQLSLPPAHPQQPPTCAATSRAATA